LTVIAISLLQNLRLSALLGGLFDVGLGVDAVASATAFI